MTPVPPQQSAERLLAFAQHMRGHGFSVDDIESAAADLTRLNAELDARDVEAFDAAVAHGKTKLDLTRLNAKVEELERGRDEARSLVTEANNSLFGSQGKG